MKKSNVTPEQLVTNALDECLQMYGTDVLSVDYDELSGMIVINHCTRHDSFCIKDNIVDADLVDLKILRPMIDRRHVGYCF